MAVAALLGSRLRLWRCRRGAAAIEFAFALPPLILLVFGMIEISMVTFAQACLEGGLRDASRFGITGQVPQGMTRQQQIMAILQDRTLGLIDFSTATVTIKTYDSFKNVGQPESFTDANGNGEYDAGESYDDKNGNGRWDADQGADGVGGADEVVLYKVEYDWALWTPVLTRLLADGDKLRMSASIVVRNEPYDSLINSGAST